MHMSQRSISGICLAAMATTIVGLAVAASSRLTHLPPATGQAARYAVAAAVFGMLSWRRGELPRLAALRFGEWLTLGSLAATGLVGFNLAVLGSVSRIDPSLTGAIVGCAPVLLALLGPLLAGRRPAGPGIAAGLVVAAGAALVEAASTRAAPLGILLALAAVAGEALFSLLAVPLLPRLGPLTLSFAISSLATLLLLLLAPIFDGPAGPRLPSEDEALALLFLALPVTVGGFLGWYSALARLGPDRAGPFLGLIPVAAMAGSVLDGTSPFSLAKLAGVLLVGAAIITGLSASGSPR
jgi:drug/metabolite transporter (DMT)-like permease